MSHLAQVGIEEGSTMIEDGEELERAMLGVRLGNGKGELW